MAGKAPLLYGLGCFTGAPLAYLATVWYHGLDKKPAPAAIQSDEKVQVDGLLAKWGLPSQEHLTVVGKAFATSDNWHTRCPNWTLEHLTPEALSGSAAREKSTFKAAAEVPEFFRATPADYKAARQRGDYVRGHLVPAADMRSDQDAMDATFVLNHNVVPQDGTSNCCGWFHVESLVRKIAKKNPHTWVLTGPVFKPQYDPDTGAKRVTYELVGAHDIAVPTHLFKVVVTETKKGDLHSAAFLVPNSPCDEPPATYKVPTDEVAKLTGLELFKGLSEVRKGVSDLCSVEKCTEKAKNFHSGKKKSSEVEPEE